MTSSSFSTKSIDNSTVSINSSSTGVIGAKLRRLRIQEDILFQGVRRHQTTIICESDGNNDIEVHIFEYHVYIKNLNNTYMKILNLFNDVKVITHARDVLKSEDIDDIKVNVIELENNIRSFKIYLQNELGKLKADEVQLIEKMDQTAKEEYYVRKLTKIPSTPLSEIVPSPVRILVNSPFKCSAVQEFQDFMKKSPNRYGGWNEYNHHIFEKLWHKYYTIDDYENPDDPDKFMPFCHDLYQSIPGITREDIIAHHKWYYKYVQLKHNQDIAINKWRLNKRKMKKLPMKEEADCKSTGSIGSSDLKKSCNMKTKSVSGLGKVSIEGDVKYENTRNNNEIICSELLEYFENGIEHQNFTRINDETYELKKQETGLHLQYLKPTKQWNNRCNGSIGLKYNQSVNKLEDIPKRRIPHWRLGL